jgi:hypothetical protein
MYYGVNFVSCEIPDFIFTRTKTFLLPAEIHGPKQRQIVIALVLTQCRLRTEHGESVLAVWVA